MFLFISQVVLILSLGGIIFMMTRKIPVLVNLTESPQSPRKNSKSFFSMVKDINLSRSKEIFNMENLKSSSITEDKTTRKQEFDKESDYWDKVTDK